MIEGALSLRALVSMDDDRPVFVYDKQQHTEA
jgi:hypothetical protein